MGDRAYRDTISIIDTKITQDQLLHEHGVVGYGVGMWRAHLHLPVMGVGVLPIEHISSLLVWRMVPETILLQI